jgi:hypothetical protein
MKKNFFLQEMNEIQQIRESAELQLLNGIPPSSNQYYFFSSGNQSNPTPGIFASKYSMSKPLTPITI